MSPCDIKMTWIRCCGPSCILILLVFFLLYFFPFFFSAVFETFKSDQVVKDVLVKLVLCCSSSVWCDVMVISFGKCISGVNDRLVFCKIFAL